MGSPKAACLPPPPMLLRAARPPLLPALLLLQSCDGWKEVALHGEKLDVLRARFQSHQRKMAARKAGQAAQHA